LARKQARHECGDSSHFFFLSLHREQPVNDFDMRALGLLVEDMIDGGSENEDFGGTRYKFIVQSLLPN
jgi:hypothetical protein